MCIVMESFLSGKVAIYTTLPVTVLVYVSYSTATIRNIPLHSSLCSHYDKSFGDVA